MASHQIPIDSRLLDSSTTMLDKAEDELLHLNQRLLDSIAKGDWATYQDLCDPSLTAFEPEGLGQLVEGLEFHNFYFNLGGFSKHQQTTMCSPRVRIMGDVAGVGSLRPNQRGGEDSGAFSRAF